MDCFSFKHSELKKLLTFTNFLKPKSQETDIQKPSLIINRKHHSTIFVHSVRSYCQGRCQTARFKLTVTNNFLWVCLLKQIFKVSAFVWRIIVNVTCIYCIFYINLRQRHIRVGKQVFFNNIPSHLSYSQIESTSLNWNR